MVHFTRGQVVVLLCAGVAVTLAACSDSESDATSAPSPGTSAAAATSAEPEMTMTSPSGAPIADPPLPIAPADKVLVAPLSGRASAETPSFPIADNKFTVRVVCTGEGDLKISTEGQSMMVPCDGNPRRVHVATDKRQGRVGVTSNPNQRWSVAVVVTDDFTAASPTPTTLPV